MITRTHTRTYALLDAWAETLPWDCPNHAAHTHAHNPTVNQPCAIVDCGEPLLARESCYLVTQLDRDEQGREQYVCWRHVRPDDGPIRVPREPSP